MIFEAKPLGSYCTRLRGAVRQLHLSGALWSWTTEASYTPVVPAQRSPVALTSQDVPDCPVDPGLA